MCICILEDHKRRIFNSRIYLYRYMLLIYATRVEYVYICTAVNAYCK